MVILVTCKTLQRAALALATSVSLASAAHATVFHVEQYGTYLGTSLEKYQTYAAENLPDFEADVSFIDFTDDPKGFAGNIDGSTPWIGELETGKSGKGSDVNTQFFARITAKFTTAFDDIYTFRTFNDDGVFLFVDGELVINDPSLHAERQFEGKKKLAAGDHALELFFFENGGEASLEFSFADSSNLFSYTGGKNVEFAAPATVPLPFGGALLATGLVGMLFAGRRKA